MKVLITAALPYANGPLHFGHIAGAYLPADCYARFRRMQGDDVAYICGSDEYGVAITMSAEKEGRSPKEHIDIFHNINKEFFQTLGISFDHYSRTTWDGHAEFVQEFFKTLVKNKCIEEKETEQLYSEKDDQFLADRYVVGTCPRCKYLDARGDECPKCGASYEATDLKDPRSKMTNAPLILKKTRHFFMRFDLFKEELETWISEKDWKPNVKNFASQYIKDLKERAITRDSKWGVPLPVKGKEGKVLYVWFDAPIGYITMTDEWARLKNDGTTWEDYWCDPKTELVQFLGKDNIPFHAIFFPAMCMGWNKSAKKKLKLVDSLPANEFYNLEGKQFSKSSGWTINLNDFFKEFTADQIRYAIAANAPETQDAEFTWKGFQTRCNSELLGKYGNLINRVLTFAQNFCEGKIPPLQDLSDRDQTFLATCDRLSASIKEAYSRFHLREASHLVMELAQEGNAYFDHKKPWLLAKETSKRPALDAMMACCFYCLKTLALTSFPIVPAAAGKLWHLLGLEENIEAHTWQEIMEMPLDHLKLPRPKVLFKKIENDLIDAKVAALKKKKKKGKPMITFDQFQQVELKIGEVVQAKRVPKSNKLLQLQVSFGDEERQVVAGIGQAYDEVETLIGTKGVFVTNLKPNKLMGVMSEGMLLVSGDGKQIKPVTAHGEVGSTVS